MYWFSSAKLGIALIIIKFKNETKIGDSCVISKIITLGI